MLNKLDPCYPNNFTKKSVRCRKPCKDKGTIGILEYGNTAIGFRFKCDESLWEELCIWWEKRYAKEGEGFKVELFPYQGEVDLIFFETLPYYKPKKPVENSSEVSDVLAAKYIEHLPECVTSGLKEGDIFAYITDWDYIPDDRFLGGDSSSEKGR